MRMHPAAILSEDRLRHERSGEAEGSRDILHHEPEGRDVVGRLQRLRVPEIDLVLPVRNLVVSRLDLEAHTLEYGDDRAAGILTKIGGSEIEIRSDIVCDRRRGF